MQLVSIAVRDFPQQINAHAVAVGAYECAFCVCMRVSVYVCVCVCVVVSNVIETNKINGNYLVFQFVTLH